MKYLVKAETWSGSITVTIKAKNIEAAKRKMAESLRLTGCEEVRHSKPNFSEFKISKNSDPFIKLWYECIFSEEN